MTNVLIDTHAHIDFQQYDADRQDVVYRAKESGVAGIINVGIDLPTTQKSIQIAEQFTNVFATAGVHPHDVGKAEQQDLEELKELINHPKVVAIGEVGLDYYRYLSPIETQRKLLRKFLNWSLETEKPLIIHTRDADDDIIALLKERQKSSWRGVFHCFSGDEKMADKVMELGFYISFTGTITFKNSRSTQIMKNIPLERLLVETDCPFMAPVPQRGKRNEPAFVNYIAQKIAHEKNIPISEVQKITTANAIDLFNIELVNEE